MPNCPSTLASGGSRPLERHNMTKPITPAQFRAERERLRLTAQEMGDLLGVSARAIFYYEHGQRKIPLTVQKLLEPVVITVSGGCVSDVSNCINYEINDQD